MSASINPTLLKTYTQESMTEVPSSLQIEIWDNANTTFSWIVDNKVVEKVEFCINAYFNMLVSLPEWFTNIGEPSFYKSCSMPTIMVSIHDEQYPQICLGVLREGEENTVAIVVMDRGPLITILDDIGHELAAMQNVSGCSNEDEDNEEEVSNDPFFGLDTSIRH